MRLVSQLVRHVKLQQLLGPAQSRGRIEPFRRVTTHGPTQSRVLTVPITARSTTSGTAAERAPISTISAENASPAAWHQPAEPRPRAVGPPNIVDAKYYGKWKGLLFDTARLASESDFSRRNRFRKFLVDKPENRGDLALWSCLLDFHRRVNGDAGVEKVWKAVWNRKALYETEGVLGETFWQTILDTALRSNDSRFLRNVYVYGEWMKHIHGTTWPRLYTTVIRHFLRAHQHQKVMQWHMRLFPNFNPGADEFLSILRQFSTDEELYRTSTLEALYTMSHYRPLYDSMVPFLYNQGKSRLATRWRKLFLAHNDEPQQLATSRPFLRYLQGYFPHLKLSAEERNHIIARIDNEDSPQISREFVNRVHGHTFGITVKNYNDNLGARWFATSWISLDTAISTVAALGIEKIGPLSLQSIALREPSPAGFANRAEQLRTYGISMPDGNYAKLLTYFSERAEDDLYSTLVRSDFHPEVWDDMPLQKRLLEAEPTTLDARMYKLLLSANHFLMQQSAKETANALVEAHYKQQDWRGLLKVLDDMRTMEIGLDRPRAKLIFDGLLADVPWHADVHLPDTAEKVDFYLAACKQLSRMETPIPTGCWARIIRYFGRTGRLNDMEELATSLVDAYMNPQSSRPGFIPIHLDDLPRSMRRAYCEVEGIIGAYVPKDLPTQHPKHPLYQIFSPRMIGSMVRWTFTTTMVHYPPKTPRLERATPGFSRLHVARVVKHLRLLKDRGLWLDPPHLARRVLVRMSYLYGPGDAINKQTGRARMMNTIPLAAMKELVDEAWGEELLPPLPQLKEQIGRLSTRAEAKREDEEDVHLRPPHNHVQHR